MQMPWHRDHYSENDEDEVGRRRGRERRDKKQAFSREDRKLLADIERLRRARDDERDHNVMIFPGLVKKAKKVYTYTRRPEEVLEIANEIFGGRYYCVGDSKNSESNSEPAS